MELTAEELRVLGCLIEKSHTTPDQYPLTTNALVNACNQKSSRDPVVSYSERTINDVIRTLRDMGLARTVRGSGMRVHKHKHVVEEALGLGPEEQAVLAVLILRGSQSAGELKTRTERYIAFESLEAVEHVLEKLGSGSQPFIVNVGRQPGQAQDRWRHTLLLDDPEAHNESVGAPESVPYTNGESASPAPTEYQTPIQSPDYEQRLAALEARVAFLESSLGVEPDDAYS